jgi:hypothetical protein
MRLVSWPGKGVVAGATYTDTNSFAIVDLDGGLQVLGLGDSRLRLVVGDEVVVRPHGDGTYDLEQLL